MGLFWLACFRTTDFARIEFSKHLGEGWPHLVCEIRQAQVQFEEGLKILQKHLPQTDFEAQAFQAEEEKRPIEEFRDLIYGDKWKYAHLDFSQLGTIPVLMLKHALMGFDCPDCAMYHGEALRERWKDPSNAVYAMPQDSGVMTWTGVLKRLSIPSSGVPDKCMVGYDDEDGSFYSLRGWLEDPPGVLI